MNMMRRTSILVFAGFLWLPVRASAEDVEPLDSLHGKEAVQKVAAAAPGTVFVMKGQRRTREELVAEATKIAEASAVAAKNAAASSEQELSKARAQFDARQRAELDARNARLRGEFEAAKLRGSSRAISEKRLEQIRVEANTLMQRSRVAPPAERDRIEKRAAELLKEVQSKQP